MDWTPITDILDRGLSEAVLGEAMDLAIDQLSAERGCILLSSSTLEMFVYRGDETLREKFPFSREIVRHVLEDGRGLISFNAPDDLDSAESQSLQYYGVRSALCVSISKSGGTIGLVYFDNRANTCAFKETDVEWSRQFASKVAAVVPD